MNRKEFIKKSTLAGLFLASPISLLKAGETFSLEELTGQVTPNLYGKGFRLRKEAAKAFEAMSAAALKAGFKPYAISSYRSFNHQKGIWDRKYNRYTKAGLSPQQAIQKIIKYSTIPGTSRHHWGTDLDIIDGKVGIVENPLNEKHFNKGGVYHPFKLWLNENAAKFDFYETYTNKKGRKGFAYEPWHFSYQPTACQMLQEYTFLDFPKLVTSFKIQGHTHFTPTVINDYYNDNVLDINPQLIPF